MAEDGRTSSVSVQNGGVPAQVDLVDQIAKTLSDKFVGYLVISTIAVNGFIGVAVTTQEVDGCETRERNISLAVLAIYFLIPLCAYGVTWHD